MIPITQAIDNIYKDKQAAIIQSGSKQHMPLSRNRKPPPKIDVNIGANASCIYQDELQRPMING